MVDLTFSDAELTARREGITTFIEETVEAAGATGVMLGLSGGVDSALTAALAVEALGPDRVTTAAMPAAVSDERHVTDAREHAADLGVAFDVIEIEPIVETLIDWAPIDDVGEEPRGNARARVRG